MPADDLPTKRRLLDAAEQLLGETGYEATSLRAITRLAGANVAAVNYHWGSKDNLLRAVVARVMAPVNAERARRLDALLTGSQRPSVEDIVRAFVEPGLDLVRHHGDRSPNVARFIATVALDPNPRIREIFGAQVDPVEGRFLDALREALPSRDAAVVRLGYTSMVGLLALHQAGTLQQLTGRQEPDSDSRTATAEREYLVAFLTAGLTAQHPPQLPPREP
jgi:AcrR family transcriptional regulator